jgi:RluA family pseudouridine synthase
MFGEYCPHCYRSPEERMQESLEMRQLKILEVARSQPGSSPYTNIREIHVAGSFDGLTLIEFLKQYQPAINEADWRQWIEEGQIKDDREQLCDCNQIVRAGNAFVQEMPNTVEPAINPEIKLLYQDDSLVVIDKPAPLPCHASGRYNRNTLLYILSQAFPREKLRLAHRLDARTTGLVVLCRRHRAARNVQNQFATQAVKKTYVARVHGNPSWESTTCDLPIGAEPSGTGGVRQIDHQGQAAQTHFRVLLRYEDGTTLVEAIPLTGRTNQIRIHLQELGHSIVGDATYSSTELTNTQGVSESSAGKGDVFSPDQPQAICLHALRVNLQHPESLEPETFESPLPQWAE